MPRGWFARSGSPKRPRGRGRCQSAPSSSPLAASPSVRAGMSARRAPTSSPTRRSSHCGTRPRGPARGGSTDAPSSSLWSPARCAAGPLSRPGYPGLSLGRGTTRRGPAARCGISPGIVAHSTGWRSSGGSSRGSAPGCSPASSSYGDDPRRACRPYSPVPVGSARGATTTVRMMWRIIATNVMTHAPSATHSSYLPITPTTGRLFARPR